MKTKFLLKSILILGLFTTIAFISSCGSDEDENMDPDSATADEVSLSFTLGGTSEEAVFNSGSIFVAISDGVATVASSNGVLQSGRTYNMTFSFAGTTTGTYSLTQGAGEVDQQLDGLTLVFLAGQDSEVYLARDVTLTVESYTVISLAQIILKGTFSGTLENEGTQETISITNGSFVTGVKE